MLRDISSSAAALFDGGWRYADKNDLMEEYDLTEEEVNEICDELQKIEERK